MGLGSGEADRQINEEAKDVCVADRRGSPAVSAYPCSSESRHGWLSRAQGARELQELRGVSEQIVMVSYCVRLQGRKTWRSPEG